MTKMMSKSCRMVKHEIVPDNLKDAIRTRAYDLDDTLFKSLLDVCKHPVLAILLSYPSNYYDGVINKNDVRVIITGRSERFKTITKIQLFLFGFRNVSKILFYDGTIPKGMSSDEVIRRIIPFKIKALRELNCNTYVDSDKQVIDYMKEHWDGILECSYPVSLL